VCVVFIVLLEVDLVAMVGFRVDVYDLKMKDSERERDYDIK
jgi:hypothetical protein